MAKHHLNDCASTVDHTGVSYHERLRRLRQSSGKSDQEVAELLGISFQEYYELEHFEAELNMAMSLNDLSKLSSILGICTSLIFDDKVEDGQRVSPEQLCEKINAHLKATGLTIAEFENCVGFEIEQSLKDVTKVMDWNVDCLRFVCRELGLDWHSALP